MRGTLDSNFGKKEMNEVLKQYRSYTSNVLNSAEKVLDRAKTKQEIEMPDFNEER